jgi:SAM-dependent methyltransferase
LGVESDKVCPVLYWAFDMAKKKIVKKRTTGKMPTKRAVRKRTVMRKVTSRPLSASPLQAHFEKAGVMFGQSNSKILRKLDRLMGTERCEAWKAFSYRRHQGVETKGNEYDFFHSAAELNTLFSLQSWITLRVCEWLCEQVSHHIKDGGRIGDLGCGGGILAGWLAQQYPQSGVVGFDSLPHLIAAAAETQQAPNLAFVAWDYAKGPLSSSDRCDVLVSCFGIDFPTEKGDLHPLDATTLRVGGCYESLRNLMESFFRCWRSAANEGGKLFGVFRVPNDTLFLAAIDAAHEEGWTYEPGLSTKLNVGAEYFPAMTFTARHSHPLPEDDVLWHWIGAASPDQDETYGTEAICLYRRLADKKVLREESRTWEDNLRLHGVVGTADRKGYEFTHATSGYARLKIISLDAALTAEPWFPPEDFQFNWQGFF